MNLQKKKVSFIYVLIVQVLSDARCSVSVGCMNEHASVCAVCVLSLPSGWGVCLSRTRMQDWERSSVVKQEVVTPVSLILELICHQKEQSQDAVQISVGPRGEKSHPGQDSQGERANTKGYGELTPKPSPGLSASCSLPGVNALCLAGPETHVPCRLPRLLHPFPSPPPSPPLSTILKGRKTQGRALAHYGQL